MLLMNNEHNKLLIMALCLYICLHRLIFHCMKYCDLLQLKWVFLLHFQFLLGFIIIPDACHFLNERIIYIQLVFKKLHKNSDMSTKCEF
jgi:hypothetical protein